MRCFRGHITHASSKLMQWRKAVAEAVSREIVEPMLGAIYLHAVFVMPRPKSSRRAWPTVKPDCDKLLRAIGDALVDAGALKDDAQIVETYAMKRYPGNIETPGALLFIKELD